MVVPHPFFLFTLDEGDCNGGVTDCLSELIESELRWSDSESNKEESGSDKPS